MVFSLLITAGLLIKNNADNDKKNISVKNNANYLISTKNNNNMKTVVSDADFAKIYENLNSLVSAAQIIVEGEVLDVNYFDYNTITRTKYQLKVTKTYKSNIKVGEILTFVEVGGITTEAAIINNSNNKMNQQIGEKEKSTKVQVLFHGAPLTKVNQKVLIFANQGTLNMLPEKYYVSIGSFQGKFNINGDSLERFSSSEMDSKYNSNSKYNKVDLENRLNNLIK